MTDVRLGRHLIGLVYQDLDLSVGALVFPFERGACHGFEGSRWSPSVDAAGHPGQSVDGAGFHAADRWLDPRPQVAGAAIAVVDEPAMAGKAPLMGSLFEGIQGSPHDLFKIVRQARLARCSATMRETVGWRCIVEAHRFRPRFAAGDDAFGDLTTFGGIKQFRAIATCHDKIARNFLAAIRLAASVVWLY